MMCNGCPFNHTDESDKIQNYGCLPSGGQILNRYKTSDEVWMCHSNEDRICQGLKEEVGAEFKTNNKTIRLASES